MTEGAPQPRSKRERRLLEAVLGVLTVGCAVVGWYGVFRCSPYHPCGIWWQWFAGMGFAGVSIFGNALAFLLIWRSVLETIRRLGSGKEEA